jgi:hypothetical protein
LEDYLFPGNVKFAVPVNSCIQTKGFNQIISIF